MISFRAPGSFRGGLARCVCGLGLAVVAMPAPAADPTLLCLDTCEAVRAAFREFRHDAFPEGMWTCDEGVLRSVPGRKVDLVTREEFGDFELELEWKTAVGANSGIMYGVDEAGSETFWSGPEMQINDDPNHSDGLEPKTSAGGLYDLIAPSRRDTLKPTGEFNHVRLISRAGHVEHWQNGVKVVEYEWNSPSVRALIAGTKFATSPLFMVRRRGHIALQSEGDEVWFRNIRIRRLDLDGAESQSVAATASPI